MFKTVINAYLSQGFFYMETKEKHKIYRDFLFNRDIQDIQDKQLYLFYLLYLVHLVKNPVYPVYPC